MQTTFTIEEIRKYILSQDSLGDILYNLKAEKIIQANSADVRIADFKDDEYDEDYEYDEYYEYDEGN